MAGGLTARNADLPHTVYIAWTRWNRTCLYVGCTVNEHGRINAHRGSDWWPFAYHFDLYDYPTLVAGRSAEAQKIRELRPLFNVQHHPAPIADPLAELARRGEEPKTADERLAEAWVDLKAALRAEAEAEAEAARKAIPPTPVWELRLAAAAASTGLTAITPNP